MSTVTGEGLGPDSSSDTSGCRRRSTSSQGLLAGQTHEPFVGSISSLTTPSCSNRPKAQGPTFIVAGGWFRWLPGSLADKRPTGLIRN